MKKYNWYYKQKVDLNDMRDAFNSVDDAIKRIIIDYENIGFITSPSVVQNDPSPDFSVDVNPGAGYDQNGERVFWTSKQDVSLTTDEDENPVTLPSVGNEKYITLLVGFTRLESQPEIDGNSVTVNYVSDESFTFSVIQGLQATAGSATKPTDPGDGRLIIADILLTSSTSSITNGIIDQTRIKNGKRKFLNLDDVPNSYIGNAGKTLIVNGTEDALEFGVVSGGSGDFSSELLEYTTLHSNRNFELVFPDLFQTDSLTFVGSGSGYNPSSSKYVCNIGDTLTTGNILSGISGAPFDNFFVHFNANIPANFEVRYSTTGAFGGEEVLITPDTDITLNFSAMYLRFTCITGSAELNSYGLFFNELATVLGAFSLGNLDDVDIPSPNDGEVLTYNSISGNWESSTASAGVSEFTGLSDTPADYTNQALKKVRVNDIGGGSGDQLVFIEDKFTSLVDTPSNIIAANKKQYTRVKQDLSGLEFYNPTIWVNTQNVSLNTGTGNKSLLSGVGDVNLPVNYFEPGKLLKIKVVGQDTLDGASDSIQIRLDGNIISTITFSGSSGSLAEFIAEWEIVCRTGGVTGELIADQRLWLAKPGVTFDNFFFTSQVSFSPIDLAVARVFDVFGIAGTVSGLTIKQVIVEALN